MSTETTELKYTALFPQHEALGAKIVPFGGYAMPVSYPTGQIAEHNAVRTSVGMFDVGHMGVLQLDPNDLKEDVLMVPHEEMPTYRIRYNRLINDQDGVVDDILVYRDPEGLFLVVNASNREKVKNFFDSKKIPFDELPYQLLALQGPKAKEVLQTFCNIDLNQIKYYHYQYGSLKVGGQDIFVLLSRTGYTGEDGFEIFLKPGQIGDVWKKLLELKVVPCGLGARDTLRIEAGMPLYGHELKDDWTSAKSNEIKGVVFDSKIIPREGFPVFKVGGSQIGIVTSGTYSPTLEKPIAIVWLSEAADKVEVEVRGKKVTGTVQKLPFYKRPKI